MLQDRYKKLTSPPTKKNIHSWTQEWEQMTSEIRDVGLPMMNDEDVCRDFLNAGSKWAPDFCKTWPVVIRNTGGQFHIHTAIKEYRHAVNQVTTIEANSNARGIAFAANLQGSSQNRSNHRRNPPAAGQRSCVCGEIHEYKECGYLKKEARMPTWTENKSKKRRSSSKD